MELETRIVFAVGLGLSVGQVIGVAEGDAAGDGGKICS